MADRLRAVVARPAVEATLLAGALVAAGWLTLQLLTGWGDAATYRHYAGAFWSSGRLPAEYPPLAVAVFSLALIPPLPGELVYVAWSALLFAAGYLWIRHEFGRPAAVAFAVYAAAGGFSFLLGRYDLFPALLTAGALACVLRGRFALAYLLLAAGALLKLYPAVLVPLVVIAQARPAGGRAALLAAGWFLIPVLIAFGATALLAGAGWTAPFRYAAARPVQVESIPASLLWLGSLAGVPVRPDHSFHSYNLVSPAAPLAVAAGALLAAGGWLAAAAGLWAGRLDASRAFTLGIAALIAGGKVFSPQYIAWLAPLLAVSEGLDAGWLLVALLTTLVFPIGFMASGLRGFSTPAAYPVAYLAAIAIRNAALLAAAARLLRSDAREGQQPRARRDVKAAAAGGEGDEMLARADRLADNSMAIARVEPV